MWRGNFSHRWEDVCAFYYVPAPALSAFGATTAKRFSRERSPSRLGRVQSNQHSLRSVKPPGTASSCTVEQMPWQNKLPTCCEGCQSRIDGSGLFSARLQVMQTHGMQSTLLTVITNYEFCCASEMMVCPFPLEYRMPNARREVGIGTLKGT